MWTQILMIVGGLAIVGVGFIFLLRSADKQLTKLKNININLEEEDN